MNIIPGKENQNIKRLNQIYKVLKKNDFGYLIEKNTFIKKFPFMRNKKIENLPLDDTVPVRIRNVLEELGPTYIKLGQMLSTRPDLVGWDVANELQKLRDNTPADSFSQIKEVIETELGQKIDEVYKDFDTTPIGSASIGQVYKAILIENDEEVAIKVQKPHITKLIKTDLRIMEFLAKNIDKYIVQTHIYNLPAIVEEFKRSILKELNYEDEVKNMEHLAYNFRYKSGIHVPKAYRDYCTKKIITMEYIKGKEVSKIFDTDNPKYNKKLIANRGVKSYFKMVLIDGFFHADPHPGNIIIMDNNVVCYIDEGMMGILDDNFRENLSELMILLISGNTDYLINQLIYMDIITSAQNTPTLKEDINDLMNKYYGTELKYADGGLQDLLNVMIKNQIRLPREFVMIGRGVTLIEETGKKLDPEFNAALEIKKMSKKIIINKYSPKRLMSVGSNYFLEMEHLAKNLPDKLNSIINKFENGEVSITLKHSNLDAMTDKLSISLILSALLIGSSLTIIANSGPKLFDTPVIGLIGFSFSLILAIYLLIKYLQRNYDL